MRSIKTLGKVSNRVLGLRKTVLDILKLGGHFCGDFEYVVIGRQILFFTRFACFTFLIGKTCGAVSRVDKELTDAPHP